MVIRQKRSTCKTIQFSTFCIPFFIHYFYQIQKKKKNRIVNFSKLSSATFFLSANRMERRKQKDDLTVPKFGGWEEKVGGGFNTDYSMVFNRARANRKQVKKDRIDNPNSIGNEAEINPVNQQQHNHAHDDSVTRKKRILSYFSCCIRV
ncbi:hypothetical protein C5167_001885 [Papaver somniferum]|uniref:RIN4 pathogenic type III effector avirulence factor Avr cleavage site domain-containing protein n=1 Tax=Papaver somniferum TaxID=3469 RepID=A0A4Y7KZ53_PAPSO|nr:hypothetical protein C5167_001885 [Papaver somniferum]